MFEKVNPMHPDKVADRIAGALVDTAYANDSNPKIAVEVLIGHGKCHIIAETSVHLDYDVVKHAVCRIAKENLDVDYVEVPQDVHLADNQKGTARCGDNGIFKGVPTTEEQKSFAKVAQSIYTHFPYDGKYIVDEATHEAYFCQSNASEEALCRRINILRSDEGYKIQTYKANPLGEWSGGTSVDSGATNRKLGSDMGDSVTGGGLMGKDCSKADVSVNIACFLMANESGKVVAAKCAIGDEKVTFNIGDTTITLPYASVVAMAREYIDKLGGFEAFAEWGLIR